MPCRRWSARAADESDDVARATPPGCCSQRAAEQGIRVDVGPQTAARSRRICARLEGIPLALELAAARLRTLSVEDLDRHLQDDLRVLAPTGADGPDARRTLDGLIESSLAVARGR